MKIGESFEKTGEKVERIAASPIENIHDWLTPNHCMKYGPYMTLRFFSKKKGSHQLEAFHHKSISST
ncbi:hypothetical protein BpJC7_16640 [Weizmannia acidilactici]|uniref:Uncharacterized protein n=1 Tax=Weizmannia acidilactici TaxID=2607726 RepID=A0A5J4JFA2_9BACI|nr:hypothetical protein [Weizmannia acidilactici]GER68336.1 hypothetical protein BpJC4_28070 [Weizmannia acidilactici]GER70361.1 hypothetical protein BpJC7_16640 [Weizmannia acidilactici]